MGVLLWAMLEAESSIPEERHKWRVFRSLRYRQIPTPAPLVMGFPAPRMQAAPTEIEARKTALVEAKGKAVKVQTARKKLKARVSEVQ